MDQPLHSERTPDGPKHYVTRYRRRDLRSDVLGARLDRPEPPKPKYKIKMTKIPLDVSDYTLDDLVKDFGHPALHTKLFDNKEDRTFIVEFETLDIMNEFVAKYNHYEIEDGFKVTVEVFEQKSRKQKNNRNGISSYGSHYERQPQPRQERGRGGPKRERPQKPTLEELDAQLAAYMNTGDNETAPTSAESTEATPNPPQEQQNA